MSHLPAHPSLHGNDNAVYQIMQNFGVFHFHITAFSRLNIDTVCQMLYHIEKLK